MRYSCILSLVLVFCSLFYFLHFPMLIREHVRLLYSLHQMVSSNNEKKTMRIKANTCQAERRRWKTVKMREREKMQNQQAHTYARSIEMMFLWTFAHRHVSQKRSIYFFCLTRFFLSFSRVCLFLVPVLYSPLVLLIDVDFVFVLSVRR